MKTFLDRFRRKGKGDEPSEGVPDLFAAAKPAPAEGKAGNGNGPAAEAKAPALDLTPVPPAATRSSDTQVRLALGDFLHRIPQNLLRPGPHDVAAELIFNINDLSALIADGQTSLNLLEIYRRAPAIFRKEVRAEDRIEIRFPWQKLMHLVKSPGANAEGVAGITPAAADALAQKFRSRRPARNVLPTAGSVLGGKAGTATPTPAFREPSASAKGEPSSENAEQLNWFNKPGTEKPPAPVAPAAEAPPMPVPANANREEIIRARDAATLKLTEVKGEFARQSEAHAAEREALCEERDRALAELENTKTELAAKVRQIAQHESLGAKQAEETAEVIAQRVALEKQVAEQAATLESIKAELDGLRQGGGKKFTAIAEERDKVLADLQQTRKELADKIDQIEFQQSLSSRSTEDVAKLAADREALQQELAARTGDLESLRTQLEALAKTSDEKFAALAGERDKVAADLQRAHHELADKTGEVDLQQTLHARTIEESSRFATEREALRQEVAAKAADIEAIKTELHELRKGGGEQFAAVAEERDKVRAELIRAREELAAKVAEAELQKSLAGTTAVEVTAAAARHLALEQELAAKSAQVSTLTTELASHKKAGGQELAALVQERDSLLAQKTALTSQLTQASSGLAAKQKAGVEVDLLRKENKRQVEELQRRINAFESGQRATSQELNRERETRIKAERALAAAERTRQEASAMIESMRNETRREGDAAARKRESESLRLQKELQETIETLTEANRKAIAERDGRIAEIEKIRAEAAAALEAAKAAAASDLAKSAEWESRAVAGLEEDVAKYRERIKALLLERDAAAAAAKTQIETLTRAREVAAQDLETATAAHGKSASEHKRVLQEVEAKAATLGKEKTQTLQELEQSRQNLAQQTEQLAAAQTTAQTSKAAVAELRQQIEKISGERDKVQGDWKNLAAELDAANAEAKLQSDGFAKERAELEKAGGAALAGLRRRAEDLQQSLEAITSERAALQEELRNTAASLEHSEAGHTSLLATHQAAAADFARNLTAQEKTASGLRGEIGELKSALDTVSGERAELHQRFEAATAEQQRSHSEHETQFSSLRTEHTSLLATHQAAAVDFAKNLAAQENTANGLREEIGELKTALETVNGERAELHRRLEAATAEQQRSHSDHEAQFSSLRVEHTGLLATHQAAAGEFAETVRGYETTAAALRAEIGTLNEALTARADEARGLQKRIEEIEGEFERTRTEHENRVADLRVAHSSELASHQDAAGNLAKAAADHERIVTALRGEVADSKLELSALTTQKDRVQKDFDAASALLDQVKAEHDTDVRTLRAEHESALSIHEAASAKLSGALREKEETVGRLEGEIAESKSALGVLTDERGKLGQELAAATTQLERARAEGQAQTSAMRSEHEAATGKLSAAIQQHEQTIAGLRIEIGDLKKSVSALTAERSQAQKKLEAAKGEIKKAKTEAEKQLASLRAEHGQLRTAHQTVSGEFAAALQGHQGTVAGLQEEMQRHLAASAADLARTQSEYDQQLTTLRAEHGALVASHHAAAADFARAMREHESAVAALHSELSQAKASAARELAYTQSAHEEARAQFEKDEQLFNQTKKELENRVADAERATGEIAVRAQSLETAVREREAALRKRDDDLAGLKKAHEAERAELSREHVSGLDAVTAGKDRELAALTAERAQTVAGLTREREQLAAKLAETEHALIAQIAALTTERDESNRESAALAQRLAAFALESERKHEELERAHAALTDERHALAAELHSAKEAHTAQSGVFAREFKGVVKQRDDALNAVNAARAEVQEKGAALSREKANLERVEAGVTERFEREIARMRRERDALVRQRDELHARISRMIEEQREMLEELNVQSIRRGPLPNDVMPTPRAPKESNVIEITEAEIVQPPEPDHGIHLPRIRPVPIHPPNVRVL